ARAEDRMTLAIHRFRSAEDSFMRAERCSTRAIHCLIASDSSNTVRSGVSGVLCIRRQHQDVDDESRSASKEAAAEGRPHRVSDGDRFRLDPSPGDASDKPITAYPSTSKG